MRVFQVTAVVVLKSSNLISIHVMGLVSSTGWSNPCLVVDDSNPADNVLEYSFEADRPSGVTLPILTPTIASVTVQAGNIEAIIVKARSNSMTVHASEFQTYPALVPEANQPSQTGALLQNQNLTTLVLGEEDPPHITQRFGEGPPWTTIGIIAGEEDPPRLPPRFTTLRLGEEGPIGPLGTDVRVDDPAALFARSSLASLLAVDPRSLNQGNPFSGF